MSKTIDFKNMVVLDHEKSYTVILRIPQITDPNDFSMIQKYWKQYSPDHHKLLLIECDDHLEIKEECDE